MKYLALRVDYVDDKWNVLQDEFKEIETDEPYEAIRKRFATTLGSEYMVVPLEDVKWYRCTNALLDRDTREFAPFPRPTV